MIYFERGEEVTIKENATLFKSDLRENFNRYFPDNKGTVIGIRKNHTVVTLRCRCRPGCSGRFDFYTEDLKTPNMLDEELFEI
jgi:hypothetical protein